MELCSWVIWEFHHGCGDLLRDLPSDDGKHGTGDTTSINQPLRVCLKMATLAIFFKVMGVSTGPQKAGFPGVTVVAYSIAIYT